MANQDTFEQLKLKKITLNKVEVSAEHVSGIEIYESITQPGINGFIDIMDYQALFEKKNVFANDELEISFSVEGKADLIVKYAIISNEGNKVVPNVSYNVLRFGFCSKWLVPALTTKMTSFFKDKYIHEIIEEVITGCGGKVKYIEPTKQKLESFITPLWSPYHTIKHLLSFALNENNSGGYLCWTDLKTDEVYVTTLNYLLKENLGRFDQFTAYPINPRYHGRIQAMTFETNYDIVRLINSGATNTTLVGFNYDKKKIFTAEKKLEEVKQKHLSKKFPIPKKVLVEDSKTQTTKNIQFCSLFPSTKAPISGKDSDLQDLLDGSLQNFYSLISTDVFKVNIQVIGTPDRRVGWLAKLNVPPQNINVEGQENEIYNQYTGDYLIRDIKHVFSVYEDYKQYICLCADGYKIFERDAVEWKSN